MPKVNLAQTSAVYKHNANYCFFQRNNLKLCTLPEEGRHRKHLAADYSNGDGGREEQMHLTIVTHYLCTHIHTHTHTHTLLLCFRDDVVRESVACIANRNGEYKRKTWKLTASHIYLITKHSNMNICHSSQEIYTE